MPTFPLKGEQMEREKYEGLLEYLYRTNEKYLMLSTFIFLGSLFLGYFLAGFFDPILSVLVDQFRRSIQQGDIRITTLSIFFHNLYTALLIYIGGVILGIFTAIFISINGLFIGYFATKNPAGDFLLLLLPHGIFEIPALIIAGAAGFRLSSFITHFMRDLITESWYGPFSEKLRLFFDKNFQELKDSLTIFIIAVILLFIAAVIEANFTLAFYSFIKGSI